MLLYPLKYDAVPHTHTHFQMILAYGFVCVLVQQSTCSGRSPFGIVVGSRECRRDRCNKRASFGTRCFSLPNPLGRCHNTFNGLTQTMWLMYLKPKMYQKLDEIWDRRLFFEDCFISPISLLFTGCMCCFCFTFAADRQEIL